MINTLKLLLAACSLTGAVRAADLNWDELARRPDLWPTQCTSRQPIKIQGGANVEVGQKLNVIRIKPNEAQVCTADGRTVFGAAPGDTDVLAVAREAYNALTPKQQDLSYEVLLQRRDLWPARVTLLTAFDLGGGKMLRRGDQLRVLGIAPGSLSLLAENLNATFNFAPQATDVMAQARKFVEDEHAGPRINLESPPVDESVRRAGPVLSELEGKLIDPVTNRPAPLDANALPRFIVFYRGASSDPFTKGFTPNLVKYYQEVKPLHPEFEVVYLMTEPAATTAKFAKKMGFSWRAVTVENLASMPTTARAIGGLLPQLIVMDRSGRVLINGMQTNAMAALRQLDALLRMPAAGN
jgi:hypothetical protein